MIAEPKLHERARLVRDTNEDAIRDSGVYTPPELRGLTGDAYRAKAAELVAAGVEGANKSRRISGDTLFAVYGAICDLYGRDGPYAWARRERLAADAHCSVHTVKRAIARLKSLGYIQSRRWGKSGGGRLVDRYYLPEYGFPAPPSGTVRGRWSPEHGRYLPVDN